MPYDEELADRLRLLLSGRGLSEKKMFGGLAFLLGGHMAVAASGEGGLLVRVPPEETDALRREPGVQPFVMQGRTMCGWLAGGAGGAGRRRRAEHLGRARLRVRRVAAAQALS